MAGDLNDRRWVAVSSSWITAGLLQLTLIITFLGQDGFWRDWQFYLAVLAEIAIVNVGIQIRGSRVGAPGGPEAAG